MEMQKKYSGEKYIKGENNCTYKNVADTDNGKCLIYNKF